MVGGLTLGLFFYVGVGGRWVSDPCLLLCCGGCGERSGSGPFPPLFCGCGDGGPALGLSLVLVAVGGLTSGRSYSVVWWGGLPPGLPTLLWWWWWVVRPPA